MDRTNWSRYHEYAGAEVRISSRQVYLWGVEPVAFQISCRPFRLRVDSIRFIRAELQKMGFLLNEQKTQIQRSGQQQTVTGIVFNEKPSAPVDYRRKLRQELYYCRKFGIQKHLLKIGLEIPGNTYRIQLLGKVSYVLQVHLDDQDMLEARMWLQKGNATD